MAGNDTSFVQLSSSLFLLFGAAEVEYAVLSRIHESSSKATSRLVILQEDWKRFLVLAPKVKQMLDSLTDGQIEMQRDGSPHDVSLSVTSHGGAIDVAIQAFIGIPSCYISLLVAEWEALMKNSREIDEMYRLYSRDASPYRPPDDFDTTEVANGKVREYHWMLTGREGAMQRQGPYYAADECLEATKTAMVRMMMTEKTTPKVCITSNDFETPKRRTILKAAVMWLVVREIKRLQGATPCYACEKGLGGQLDHIELNGCLEPLSEILSRNDPITLHVAAVEGLYMYVQDRMNMPEDKDSQIACKYAVELFGDHKMYIDDHSEWSYNGLFDEAVNSMYI